jgi:hypothetical protein
LHGAHTSRSRSGKSTSLSRSGYTRARAPLAFLVSRAKLPHGVLTFLLSSLPSFTRVLPASRLLPRARLRACRRPSAITRWGLSFRRRAIRQMLNRARKYCRLYVKSSTVTLAVICLRRARVVGLGFAAGAPPPTCFSSYDAACVCGAKSRSWLPVAPQRAGVSRPHFSFVASLFAPPALAAFGRRTCPGAGL